jgi:hypothetical protein
MTQGFLHPSSERSRQICAVYEAQSLAARSNAELASAATLAHRSDVEPGVFYDTVGHGYQNTHRATTADISVADRVKIGDVDAKIRSEVAWAIGRPVPELGESNANYATNLMIETFRLVAADQLRRVSRLLSEEIEAPAYVSVPLSEHLSRDGETIVIAPTVGRFAGGQSCASPTLSRMESRRPSASAIAWIFVFCPPRERPIGCLCPPFLRPISPALRNEGKFHMLSFAN